MSTRERLTNLYEQFLKKRPKQSRSRTIVESILRGALDRLASGGGDADGLKIEEVAARAGVAIGSVYDYFPNRDEMLRFYRERTPAGRLVEPADVADAVCFLASPGAAMVRGQTLVVDGGYSNLA